MDTVVAAYWAGLITAFMLVALVKMFLLVLRENANGR